MCSYHSLLGRDNTRACCSMEKLAALNLLRDNGGVDVQVTVWLFILITRLHFENGLRITNHVDGC